MSIAHPDTPLPDRPTRPDAAPHAHRAPSPVPGTGPGAASSPATGPACRVLLGIAAGDAAGWPAARHRAHGMPGWTRRLTRELELFSEQAAVTTLPVPVALNQAPGPLRLGPSDDAEWAARTVEAILAAGSTPDSVPDSVPASGDTTDTPPGGSCRPSDAAVRASLHRHWQELAAQAAQPVPEAGAPVLRARISVRAGLANLAAGLLPPASGHDNPHYFDDAACVRAAVLATLHPGDPDAAARLAAFDARYTQDGDGVDGARATAAAVAAALGGRGVRGAVAAALAELPQDTELGRNARHAVDLAERTEGGPFALVPLLEHDIVDHVYSYGVAAAETLPVALALTLAAGGRLSVAVPAAVCLSRVADSAPALTGALAGALGSPVPASWRATCRTLAGCVLPALAGTDLVDLAARLDALTAPCRTAPCATTPREAAPCETAPLTAPH